MHTRQLHKLLTALSSGLIGLLLCAPPAIAKPTYSLRQLVALTQQNYPGITAAKYASEAMAYQLARARWAWLPQAQIKGFIAPAPEIECKDPSGQPNSQVCAQTNAIDARNLKITGVTARIELELGMPLYTFGKIQSAKEAATAGLAAQKAQIDVATQDAALLVVQAYWGVKLATQLNLLITEGQGHLIKARNKVSEELKSGTGESTMTDLLRLQTFEAEIESRLAEADKLKQIAAQGLATLCGLNADSFELDTTEFEPLSAKLAPPQQYIDLAQHDRPEMALLQAAVNASKAGVSLERANFLPDFLLVGWIGYATTSSVDDPQSAFAFDPFNFFSVGFGLALRWNLDGFQTYGRYKAAIATQQQAKAKVKEATAGIDLEIRRVHSELAEAQKRYQATQIGQQAARKWLVATSQNLEAGLSEPKDLTDALLAFFQLKAKQLQAVYDVNVGWSRLGRASSPMGPGNPRHRLDITTVKH